MKMLSMLRDGWERLSIYLPMLLMALLALGTYWLVRNAPTLAQPTVARELGNEPDYFMRNFSVKTFDANGRLRSDVRGEQAWHYPETDTLEIQNAHIRSLNEQGHVTVSTAKRALSNADGSEVQLFGDAVVVREAVKDANGRMLPHLELRSEFLHAYANVERVRSHLPVELLRNGDRFTADSMDYDNLDRLLQLDGRVRGSVAGRAP